MARSDLRNSDLAIQNINQRISNLEIANKLVAKNSFLTRRKDRVNLTPKQEQQKDLKFLSSTMITAEEYRALTIPTLGISEKYKYLMGDVAPNFYGVLHGKPGQGKSTFAIEFANYLEKNHGRVVYMAAEQNGKNLALQQLLKLKRATFIVESHPNKYDTEKWIKVAQNCNFIVIDSASALRMSPEQIQLIRESAPNTGFLVILQTKKDGEFKGSQQWEHDCSIFMNANKMKIFQTKSRYGIPPSHIDLEIV